MLIVTSFRDLRVVFDKLLKIECNIVAKRNEFARDSHVTFNGSLKIECNIVAKK
uniref:Uncharacterized protein n=1 Tax=viral metagenome TaxID=1070528 RepID=A0A6C0CAI4_9ZZZZ